MNKISEYPCNFHPNLRGGSKGLGYAGFVANIWENSMDIYENGQVGLGNIVDISLSTIGLLPMGQVVGFVYLGSDYLWFKHSGMSIRDYLNNNSIKF